MKTSFLQLQRSLYFIAHNKRRVLRQWGGGDKLEFFGVEAKLNSPNYKKKF